MKLFFLISLCFLMVKLELIYGQQKCGQEIENFRKCMDKKQPKEDTTEAVDIPEGSVSEEIIHCFIDNKCHPPRLAGDQAAGYEVLMGALIKCSDEVKDKIKPVIQECMVNSDNIGSGFVLHPDMIAPIPLTMPNPPPAPPAVVLASAAPEIYNNQLCATDHERKTVRSCVDKVSRKFIPFNENKCAHPLDVGFDLTEHCFNREVCKSKMTPTCKQDMENIVTHLCNCAKQKYPDAASVKSLGDTFETCVAREFGDSAIKKPAVDTFVNYAHRDHP